MKHKAKLYAKALAEIITEGKTAGVARAFFNLLEKNGDMKKAAEIVALAERQLLKQGGNRQIVLQTAREADAEGLMKAIAKKGDAVKLETKPDLVAGVKIIIDNEKQLDFSLKSKLDAIFK